MAYRYLYSRKSEMGTKGTYDEVVRSLPVADVLGVDPTQIWNQSQFTSDELKWSIGRCPNKSGRAHNRANY